MRTFKIEVQQTIRFFACRSNCRLIFLSFSLFKSIEKNIVVLHLLVDSTAELTHKFRTLPIYLLICLVDLAKSLD